MDPIAQLAPVCRQAAPTRPAFGTRFTNHSSIVMSKKMFSENPYEPFRSLRLLPAPISVTITPVVHVPIPTCLELIRTPACI